MKIFKPIAHILLMAFAVAYCHYASDVLFNDEYASPSRDFLKKEYFDSLIVGFCAAVPAILGAYYFNQIKSRPSKQAH